MRGNELVPNWAVASVVVVLGTAITTPADTETFWEEMPALVPIQMMFPPDFDPEVSQTFDGYGISAEDSERHTAAIQGR